MAMKNLKRDSPWVEEGTAVEETSPTIGEEGC
jgi:hypothetical protein